jgi:hypothetical protein
MRRRAHPPPGERKPTHGSRTTHDDMQFWLERFRSSPIAVRVVPFAIFLLLTFAQGKFGEASRYWFYLAKTLAGAGMIWAVRPWIPEMRWKLSWSAVAAGLGVLGLWVGLDGWYPSLDQALTRVGLGKSAAAAADPPWNPHAMFGQGSLLAWFFVMTRLVGSTLVVPPLEEVFYRSFVYRYLADQDFLKLPLAVVRWVPFTVTAIAFGLTHVEWLAGILCGMIYQGLVCWKGRLGDAMGAHALTNLGLGLWVITREAWHFW